MKKDETDHEAAERRGLLHEALCKLVQEHGLSDVTWMVGVIKDDNEINEDLAARADAHVRNRALEDEVGVLKREFPVDFPPEEMALADTFLIRTRTMVDSMASGSWNAEHRLGVLLDFWTDLAKEPLTTQAICSCLTVRRGLHAVAVANSDRNDVRAKAQLVNQASCKVLAAINPLLQDRKISWYEAMAAHRAKRRSKPEEPLG